MLKKRLIATLIIKDGYLVQSVGFKKYLPIGRPIFTIELISRWDVDEIVLIDIDCSIKNKKIDMSLLKKLSRSTSVPLTIGGGINSLNDIEKILSIGADKVLINTALISKPKLIFKIKNTFGSQCLVAGVDVFKNKNNYDIYSHCGNKKTKLKLLEWINFLEEQGAGEILINCIHRDGSKKGYDLKLINKIIHKTKIPVIFMGGAGSVLDFLDAFKKTKVEALAAANFFNFIEHSTIITKSFLLKNKVNIRLESHASYQKQKFDYYGRLLSINSDKLSKIKLQSYSK